MCLVMFTIANLAASFVLFVMKTTTMTTSAVAFSWIVYVSILSPTIMSSHCTVLAADRYSYLPAALLGVPLTASVFVKLSSPRANLTSFFLLFLLMMPYVNITSQLVNSWEIEENLWRRLIEINPKGDDGLYMNLGNHLLEMSRFEDASELYETALFHHNISSSTLVMQYAASLSLRELQEDSIKILRENLVDLNTPGISLLISNLYDMKKNLESYVLRRDFFVFCLSFLFFCFSCLFSDRNFKTHFRPNPDTRFLIKIVTFSCIHPRRRCALLVIYFVETIVSWKLRFCVVVLCP